MYIIIHAYEQQENKEMNNRIAELIKMNSTKRLEAFPNGVGARYVTIDGSPEKLIKMIIEDCLRVPLYGEEFEQARNNIKLYFGIE